MKTIKSKHLYAFLALSAAVMSCQKTGPDAGTAGGRIIPRLASSVFTKAETADPEQNMLFEYSDEEMSVTLFEEDNLSGISDVPTKGGIVTTSGLNKAGQEFRMDAWLGSENRYDGTQDGRVYDVNDKDNYHFISSETVSYSSGSWSMGAEYSWRNLVPTSFWSLYPVSAIGWTVTLPGNTATDDVQKKLSFTYTIPNLADGAGAEGQPDLCVAFSHKTWEDGSDNFVDIDFKHALSAVLFDVTGIPEGITVTKIAIKGLKGKGTCTVTGSTSGESSSKDVTFEWTPSGENSSWSQSYSPSDFVTDGGRKVTDPSGSKIFMLIPQTLTSDAKLSVTFSDGTNTATKEAAIGDGSSTIFRAGKKYTFRLNVKDGELTAGLPDPYNGDPLEGTDLGDDGLDPYNGDPLGGDPDPVLGPFSVSATKKVSFSPGNLYWDGSAFKFEEHQYDYPTEWSTSHVGHFYWSRTASVAYAETYSDSDQSKSDVFFTNAASDSSTPNPEITVNGEKNKWMTLSADEWFYLLNTRTVNGGTKEAKSYQRATINSDATGGGVYGMILYPDNFTAQKAETSYTSAEWTTMEQAGCVFLPAAGWRYGSDITADGVGYYWTGSSFPLHNEIAQNVTFNSDYVKPDGITTTGDARFRGSSVRLVTASN